MKARLTFAVALASLIALAIVIQMMNRSIATVHSLGEVEPGQKIDIAIEIQNPFDSYAIISGVRDNCGVTFRGMDNLILKPKERKQVLATMFASHLPGERNGRIEIVLKSGSETSASKKVFKYVVKGQIYLEKSSITLSLDNPKSSVRINNLPEGSAVTVGSVPDGLLANIKDRYLEIALVGEVSATPAIVTIEVEADGKEKKHSVSVSITNPNNVPTLYPATQSALERERSLTYEIVGSANNGSYFTVPEIECEVIHGRLQLSGFNAKAGNAVTIFFTHDGKDRFEVGRLFVE